MTNSALPATLRLTVRLLRPFLMVLASLNSGAVDSTPSITDAQRPVTYEDLIRITDLGVAAEHDGEGVALAPDGSAVAIEVRRAVPERNTTEIRWIVVSLQGPKAAVVDVGGGGDPISDFYLGNFSGYSPPQLPQWSADSKWIFYRAKHDDDVQLWRSSRDGRTQEKLTSNSAAVQRFRLSQDGKRILFTVASAAATSEETMREEGARGFLYDERFAPMESLTPIEADEPATTLWVYDSERRFERIATTDEQREFEELERGASLATLVRRANGATTWLQDLRTDKSLGINQPLTVTALSGAADAKPVICTARACTGHFKGLWLSDDGRTVYFMRWAGESSYGSIALYRWTPDNDELSELLRTDDLLEGCAHLKQQLICSHESSTTPRKLVVVDLQNGAVTTLYDPNPQFANLQLGSVAARYWRDASGVEGFGHLVKPLGYQEGDRVPLVIVQYRSRGFLRGGTGDEYPIHVLAAKGFAVLSFHRPDDPELERSSHSADEVELRGWVEFRDRRRVLSVLEAGIDELVSAEIVDPQRVGITGLSDGGETVAFAMMHEPGRFAVAAASSTFWNPILYYLAGPKFQPRLRRLQLGDPLDERALQRWEGISIGLNADRIRTPLLIQVADSELLPETQTYTALKRAGKAVEMYVFPNEGHIKSQPIHRLNVYRRNVQWLRFWLQGVEEPDPLDSLQYARWRAMREQLKPLLQTRAHRE